VGFFYRIADGYPRARAAFALISIVGGAAILVLDGNAVGYLLIGVGLAHLALAAVGFARRSASRT
jgi:hypothetical protein